MRLQDCVVSGFVLMGLLFVFGCGEGSGEETPDGTAGAGAAGGAGGSAGATGGSGAGAATGGSAGQAGAAGGAPPPGPSADGWESDYVSGGVGINCVNTAEEMKVAGVPGLTFDKTTIYVGFEQDGQNQNPVFARFDDGVKVYCEHHETEGPDGRAVGITWNGGDFAYVVYTIVGGGSSLEGKGGWVPSYAPGAISGGGPKVSYVGKVETAYGTLSSGTFIIAVKSDNKVNSHGPRGAVTVLEDGNVEFLGSSAHKPIDEGWVAMDCTDYPFDSRYRLTSGLDALVCADCTNCISKKPCP